MASGCKAREKAVPSPPDSFIRFLSACALGELPITHKFLDFGIFDMPR